MSAQSVCMQNKNCHILESYRVPMRKLRTFCGKVTEFLFLVFKQSVSNSRDFGFQKYIWSDITDPLYLPLKRGGPVCPYLEGPLEWFANCIFIQLRCEYPMHKNRRWIWLLLHVDATRNRCPINFKQKVTEFL